MLYSVFVPAEGKYHYYETQQAFAVNADLPVPTLGSDAGKIGVPAMDAARKLPSDAKFVGKGWNARGVVAMSGTGALGGFSDVGGEAIPYVLPAGAGLVAYQATRRYSTGTRIVAAAIAAGLVYAGEMACGVTFAPFGLALTKK